MTTGRERNKPERESNRMENKKGITTVMLVVLGAIVVAVIILMVVIAFANEESGAGGLGMTIGKGICGFLATSMGGFGAAICNI